jgi:putative two-component system response regulator
MAEATHADANILIIDDEPSIVRMLTRSLQNVGYTRVSGATEPMEALALLNPSDTDLIVLDINMPNMSGYEFLSSLSQRLTPDTFLPVLMVSGLPESEARLQALRAGANNFLTKPIDIKLFVAQVNSMLETRFLALRINEDRGVLEGMVRRRTAELQQAHAEILDRLGRVAEYRDDTTGQHTERVAQTCGLLARELDLPRDRVSLIVRTAPLHDIGKVGVADAILLKPGPFDDKEREIMRKHAAEGARLLSGGTSELVQMAEEIALFHHERWDGCGYPCGLKEDEIPLAARIVSVADTFDALVHQRPYKPAWSIAAAIAEIERESGRQFDPQVVRALLSLYRQGLLQVPGDAQPLEL